MTFEEYLSSRSGLAHATLMGHLEAFEGGDGVVINSDVIIVTIEEDALMTETDGIILVQEYSESVKIVEEIIQITEEDQDAIY